MIIKTVFLLLIFLYGCSPQEKCHLDSLDDQQVVDGLLNYFQHHKVDTSELLPDTLIMFHGMGGWGTFDILSSLYYREGKYLIQLDEQYRLGESREKVSTRSQREITPPDVERLFSRIRDINCSVTDLEPEFQIMDGNYYELLIKVDDRMSAFLWQESIISGSSDRYPIHERKEEVFDIVGQLLKMAGTKESEKIIYLNEHSSTPDSLKFEIYLTDCHYTKSFSIFLDGSPLPLEDFSAAFWMLKSDTADLYNRVKIIEVQYDNTIREL